MSSTAQNHLQSLQFVLRFFSIHLKWKSSPYYYDGDIQKWLEEVERRKWLLSGSMSANLLEETLSSLWKNSDQVKRDLGNECSYYLHNFSGPNITLRDAQTDEVIMDWLDPLLENLKDLICSYDPDLPVLTKEKIEELENKIISLENFLEITGKDLETINKIIPSQGMLVKTSEDLLTRVKFLIQDAIYLFFYMVAG